MRIEVRDAAERLEALVERAESGEEVILTIDGRAAVKLVLEPRALSATEKSASIDPIVATPAGS